MSKSRKRIRSLLREIRRSDFDQINHPPDFIKQITPIWIKESYMKKFELVHCTIKYKNGNLSIMGVIGPRPTGNARGSAGQIDDIFKKNDYEKKFCNGWDESKFQKFLEVWDKWHLNNFHSGCEHQDELGWSYESHWGQKCPECDYEIGTEWTCREVPQDVLEFLQSLPSAIRENPWGRLS